MGKIEQRDVVKYERLLIEKREELVQRGALGVAGGDSGVREPADLADQARMVSEDEVTERLRQTDSRLLRAIEEALERIKRGAFGVCASCGHPIGRTRLQAVPWTRLCLECKEQRRGGDASAGSAR